MLFGRKIPIVFSLAVWFGLWEMVGRSGFSSMIPPFSSVIETAFLFAVFVIVLDTQVGVQNADRSLVEMARSFGARRSQIYSKVLILSALPEILAGLRLGAIRGVKGVVIGQLLGFL